MISIQLYSGYICIIFAFFLSDTTLLEFRTHEIQRSKDPKLFGLVVHVYFLLHCISICSIITDICLGSLGQHKKNHNCYKIPCRFPPIGHPGVEERRERHRALSACRVMVDAFEPTRLGVFWDGPSGSIGHFEGRSGHHW